MSTNPSPPPSTPVPSPDGPRLGLSASYTPCRDCGEGSLVYDPAVPGTRCRCCGALDTGP